MSDFKNFAVLTLEILSAEKRTSKKGEEYLLALATLVGQAMPFKLIVTNGLTRVIAAGQTFTLKGELGYEERRQDGEQVPTYLFFPSSFDAAADQPRNFVQLSLRAGQEPTSQFSPAGRFWAKSRMALGFGKDQQGNWKPSLWFTVKAWDEAGVEGGPGTDLYALSQGDRAVITGRLVYEVNAQTGRGYPTIHATKVVAAAAEAVAATAETPGALVGEP